MDVEEEEIFIEPRVTIGAQDIISLKTVSHKGFLRYKGSLEKIVERVVIFKPFFREAVKWRQRFVVLCEGCLYIYHDEYSRSPAKALSLAYFNSIKRQEGSERRQRMSFDLIPINDLDKCLTFCSPTDEERKIWFKKIKREMEHAAHVTSHLASDVELDEYISLEKPVHTDTSNLVEKLNNKKKNKGKKKKEESPGQPPPPRKPLPPIPPADDEENENEDDDEQDNYDEISELNTHSPRPLPEVPSEAKANAKHPPHVKGQRLVDPIKPKPAPKPTTRKAPRFSKSEFEFDSSDKVRVEQLLENTAVGTFLVRKSRQDNQEVLSIKTEEGIKEYKIYNKERGLSIDNKMNWFKTTEELLDFYAEHDIPNRGLTLTRGYSRTDDHDDMRL